MNRIHEQESSHKISGFIEKLRRAPTPWVMLITFIGMGLSLLFHVLIPRRLGGSETADALIASLKVILLVDTIFREGAKFSLVPLFINEEKSRNPDDFQRWTNGILNFTLCVGTVLMLLIEVFATGIANLLLSSSSVETRSEMAAFLRLCAPLIIFGSGSTVLGAFLNSQKRFKIVACRNALPPAMATVVFIFLSDVENLAHYIAIGYACGFMLYFGWLSIGMYQTGNGYRFSWISFDALRSVKDTISLPTLGFAIRQMTARIIVEVLLVGKLGKGAITLYNSAFRIFSAIQTLIGISIATIGLPDMAANSVEDNKQKLKRTLLRNVRSVLYITVPITLILIFSTTKISQLLYGGSKIDEQSVQQIAQLLFWLSIGTVFSCLIPVLNAGLYAQKAYGLIFRNMVTMAALNLVVAYTLVTVLELKGIALAVVVTALLAVINLAFLLRKTGVFLY